MLLSTTCRQTLSEKMKKPENINFYNSIKGDVDCLDEPVHNYSERNFGKKECHLRHQRLLRGKNCMKCQTRACSVHKKDVTAHCSS